MVLQSFEQRIQMERGLHLEDSEKCFLYRCLWILRFFCILFLRRSRFQPQLLLPLYYEPPPVARGKFGDHVVPLLTNFAPCLMRSFGPQLILEFMLPGTA